MYKSLISVIIPIYKTSPYLVKCLDSVLEQTYPNIEILCINDCSPDNSQDILDYYMQKDKRLRVIIHDRNKGPSAARNTGMDNSTGKYIYFVDSDDWIDDDYLEKMVTTIEQNNVPVILNTNIFCHYESTTELHKMIQPWQRWKINTEIAGKNVISNLMSNFIMNCCYLYRKDFLRKGNIKFPEGLRHEDCYFTSVLTPYLNKLCVVYGPQYHYVKHEDSITGIWNKKKDYYDMIDILAEIYSYYKKHEFLDKYPMPFQFVKNEFRLHSDPENFFKKLKLLFIEIKNDIIPRRHLYRNEWISFFTAILSSDNVSEFQQGFMADDKRRLASRLRGRIQ
jgi:glycosyltransferase involved in cell wall biosynthesis